MDQTPIELGEVVCVCKLKRPSTVEGWAGPVFVGVNRVRQQFVGPHSHPVSQGRHDGGL